ncbi:hypothetical protein J2Y60_002908 [Arcicella sp. BE140]|nr:hypothetical protein [Arcicella sp. BE51]MDR6812702.1 hypothetical protein [Arcicella sp. BE140]MDR6824014.1 hypothetical protein [Arcicella sp. BE139]
MIDESSLQNTFIGIIFALNFLTNNIIYQRIIFSFEHPSLL